MAERIELDALEKYLWGSAELLRSHIDAGAYKQYIFPLLFFKRLCDVYDEECAEILERFNGDRSALYFEENHRIQIPNGAHWQNVREKTENIGNALWIAFQAVERANLEKLEGIFGSGDWTNKAKFPDRLLKELIEHFSSLTLSMANCPEDELGQGYEYLIKKFADDSGHTAQEFYTNRTVVRLMAEILRPEPGESIYDPTCGTAGMLISSVKWLKDHGREHRNVRLYGQEVNALTSSIARMNMFLHGIEDFSVANSDTLTRPAFMEHGQLMQFDIVMANPPYSIKQWDRDAFSSDPHGRNFLGTPPQGRADYAFFQHILRSMKPDTGRCAILFPHGVLFRKEEAALRERLIKSDLTDCVIGLGAGLFFNSPMEACIVICRSVKPESRRGKILFINAVNELVRKNAQSWLEDEHIAKIAAAYHSGADTDGFARLVTIEEAAKNNFSLSIPLYVSSAEQSEKELSVSECFAAWNKSRERARIALDGVEEFLSDITEAVNG